MDYNKIKTFLVVVENGSFSKAANVLGRTQPAVSQAIQQLEESLGLTLLERRKGKIYLTPEGDDLFRAGRENLGRLEDVITGTRRELQSLSGKIRLGAIDDHCSTILAERITRFQSLHPKVSLHISYGKSETVEKKLLENEVDVGIIVKFKHKGFFDIAQFAIEEEVLAASPAYLKRFGPIENYERALEASIVDMSSDFDCLRPWLGKNKRSLLPRLSHRTPALVIESHHGMRDFVASGFGIAMLPKHLVQREMKSGGLVQLLKHSKPTVVGIDLAVRKKRTEKLLHSIFVQHLLGK